MAVWKRTMENEDHEEVHVTDGLWLGLATTEKYKYQRLTFVFNITFVIDVKLLKEIVTKYCSLKNSWNSNHHQGDASCM